MALAHRFGRSQADCLFPFAFPFDSDR